jgi:hypothetical protein
MDSATRSIVGAGDSLTRAAVQLAERQRLASLDSAKMAGIDSVMAALGVARPDSLGRVPAAGAGRFRQNLPVRQSRVQGADSGRVPPDTGLRPAGRRDR